MGELDEEQAPKGHQDPNATKRPPAWNRWGRRALGLAMLGAAAWALYQRRGDISTAAAMLGHARMEWVAVAVILEMASMVVFARLQSWLLVAGGVRVGMISMIEITFAGNAMGTSLPGGAAWSAAWAFRQLRLRGASNLVAGWVILVAGALSSFALFVMVAIGTWTAGPHGPVSSLRPLVAGLACIPVVGVVAWYGARRSPRLRRMEARMWDATGARLAAGRWTGQKVSSVVERVRSIRPGLGGWIEAFALAISNWIFDGGCLVAVMLALRVKVPWADVLIAYSITQIAASIPLTPGGLGVVEGSLAALLTAYGMPTVSALAVVLLYRIVSFWALVPLGWLVWMGIEAAQRRGVRSAPHPWARHIHASDSVEGVSKAGPERFLGGKPCEGCDKTSGEHAA